MTEELHPQSTKDRIIAHIKTGQAHMRPRWHFVLRTALMTVGSVILLLLMLYLVSFAVFMFHENGMWFLPAFGAHGLALFLFSLPWLLVVAGIIFIAILEVLVRQYSFAYRRPLLYSLIGIIVAVTLGSLVVTKTAFHENLSRRAKVGKLPVAGPLYRRYELQQTQNVQAGFVTARTSDGVHIQTPRGDVVRILITPETKFPRGFEFFLGDRIVILTSGSHDRIEALGIQRIKRR